MTALPTASGDAPVPAGRHGPSRTLWVLAVALAVAIAALVWTRIQLGSRIGVLEDEASALHQTLAERDRTIAAQSDRLGQVREQVRGLLSLLDEPVPGTE